jgi:hypothetical protein
MKTRTLNNAIDRLTREVTNGFISALQEARQTRRPEPTTQPKIRSLDQLHPIWTWESELTWLVPDLLPEGSVNLLSAPSDTGKTWFAYFLAGAVAHGGTVFGNQVLQRKVLYLDGENPPYLVKQRLLDLGVAKTLNLMVWGGWHDDPPPGPSNNLIREFAKSEHPLLIWDSLVQFHPGDEQSSTETRRFMDQFRALAHLGATVLILHHTGKSPTSQEYRGSTDIKASVDMAYLLKKEGNGKALGKLMLEPFKQRLALVPTRLVEYERAKGFTSSAILAKPVDDKPDAVEIVREIVQATPGLNQTEIVERAVAAGSSRNKAANALKREDLFRREKSGRGNERLYYLVERPVPAQAEGDRWEGEPVDGAKEEAA